MQIWFSELQVEIWIFRISDALFSSQAAASKTRILDTFAVFDPSVDPSIRQSGRPSARRSSCLSVRWSFHPSVRRSVSPALRQCVDPFVSRSVRWFVCPSVRWSVHPSVLQSVRHSLRRSVRQSTLAKRPQFFREDKKERLSFCLRSHRG